MAHPAVFFDRDGTLIEDVDFLVSPDDMRILPNTIPGLKLLHDAGYLIVIVTNQSAVRGKLTEPELAAIHGRLVEQIAMLGGHVDAVYYCPHLPDGVVAQYAVACDCRKPRPGLFLRAARDLDIDLERSFAVGDAWRDADAALAAGVPSVKVPRPPGREDSPGTPVPILAEAKNILEAAELILAAKPADARAVVRRYREATQAATPSPGNSAAPPAPPTTPRQKEPQDDSEGEKPTTLRSEPVSQEDQPMDRQSSAGQSRGTARSALACARCGVNVPPAAVDSGAAGVVRGTMLCPACFAQATRQPSRGQRENERPVTPGGGPVAPTGAARESAAPQAEPQDLDSAVKEILVELRRLTRRQTISGEAHDMRWMAGALGQVAALFFALVMPLMRGKLEEAPLWLLVAVFAQLFALTMFYLSRSKS